MKARFHISRFTNPSGETVFRVDGKRADGGRVRKNFPTEGEAIAHKQELEAAVANLEPVQRKVTKLSSDQLAEAERAFAEVQGFKLSLLDAVRWARANYSDPQKQISAADAFTEFMEAKRRANLRPATLRSLNQRVGRIAETFPSATVSDLQPEALKSLIFRSGSGLVNQESDYRAFTNFFNWAGEQGYCPSNPMAKIPRIKLDREEPVILPLERVRLLLQAAMNFKGGVCLPYSALALFCAIRPTELAGLTWKDIDLDAATVTVGARIAKMRARRIVAISENAMQFLLPHAPKRTPLRGVNWRKDFDAVKELAGYGTPTKENPNLEPWTMDILRHTGISHHLAAHQHEGQTAAWAGNSPDVVQRHYKGLVKPGEAKDFWSITPENVGGKILTMKAA